MYVGLTRVAREGLASWRPSDRDRGARRAGYRTGMRAGDRAGIRAWAPRTVHL